MLHRRFVIASFLGLWVTPTFAAEPPERVTALLKQLALPPLPGHRKTSERELTEDDLLKMGKVLENYPDDEPTLDTLSELPERFAKKYPFRAAVAEAYVVLRVLKPTRSNEMSAPVTDQRKKQITDREQRVITDIQSDLEEIREKLESFTKKRDAEKSKLWQVHYDFVSAQAQLRLVAIFEYNLALSAVKTDKLPEINPAKENGWRLAAIEKLDSPRDLREMAAAAKMTFAKVVTDHPGTPWAMAAKLAEDELIGLEWRPAKLGE